MKWGLIAPAGVTAREWRKVSSKRAFEEVYPRDRSHAHVRIKSDKSFSRSPWSGEDLQDVRTSRVNNRDNRGRKSLARGRIYQRARLRGGELRVSGFEFDFSRSTRLSSDSSRSTGQIDGTSEPFDIVWHQNQPVDVIKRSPTIRPITPMNVQCGTVHRRRVPPISSQWDASPTILEEDGRLFLVARRCDREQSNDDFSCQARSLMRFPRHHADYISAVRRLARRSARVTPVMHSGLG